MNGNFSRALDPAGPAKCGVSSPARADDEAAGAAAGNGGNSKQRSKARRIERQAALTPQNPQDGPTVAGWIERELGLR